MTNEIFELKRLTPQDGRDIYEMLQEMPLDENGFENKFYGLSYEEYKRRLILKDSQSRGENLPKNYVPCTFFWLYANGKPVGVSKLRHGLTNYLREHGGNIGYGIRV